MTNPQLLQLACSYELVPVTWMDKRDVIIKDNHKILAHPEVIRELKKQTGHTDQDFAYEDFQKRLDAIKGAANRHINRLNGLRYYIHKKVDARFKLVK